ncbi:GABA-specific permease [Acrodontium crateriforme]|uniref:GABA-specific permease n=1 Tax=Acrodontium crateriforme TaxID=150365 RepID=A0AAQ3M1T1_9PEZI|nr:GABA-specific permease [Acrodontium crateriforme]
MERRYDGVGGGGGGVHQAQMVAVRDPDADHSFDLMDMLNDDGAGSKQNLTVQDISDMTRLGNKQEFRRNFHSLSIFGLTCVLLCTWVAILSTTQLSMINGGQAGTIWVYVAAWVFTMPVAASMAEMASMAPTAGGQYHWVSEFAPKSMQRPFSYLAGWLGALGWQTGLGYFGFQCASTILTVASLGNPSYVVKPWHETLLTIAIGIFAILFNIFGAKRLPLFEGVLLCCFFLGFFAITIPLWVLAPKAPAREVFGSFANYGDWASVGAACIVSQTSTASAFFGVDSAAHMSEEVRRASTTVPRMMMLTIAVNGFLGLVMIITFVFAVQDVQQQFVDSTETYPFIGVFYTACGNSSAAAIGMTVPVILMTFSTCINSVMAASRQAWAFARDNGTPFPRWFSKIVVVDDTPIPINSMITSITILVIVALVNLGGSEIVNSITGLSGAAFGSTYSLSIGCVLWRRLFGEPLPEAKWSLGRWGVPINIVALLYQVFSFIMSFFPVYRAVTAASMNWSIAVFGGVCIIAFVNYIFHGRRRYVGPVVRIVKDR